MGQVSNHVCNMRSAWPVGHPLPPVNADRLTGPEVGTLCWSLSECDFLSGVVVKVVERSYVWSPGECRHGGGYRRYDWSVIEYGPNKRVVVNDTELVPLAPGDKL